MGRRNNRGAGEEGACAVGPLDDAKPRAVCHNILHFSARVVDSRASRLWRYTELSSATFCTSLRELSPPTSHRFPRRRVTVCSHGSRGGNACRFLVYRPSDFRRITLYTDTRGGQCLAAARGVSLPELHGVRGYLSHSSRAAGSPARRLNTVDQIVKEQFADAQSRPVDGSAA